MGRLKTWPNIFMLNVLILYFQGHDATYTEESPVKLLEVESLADRYAASDTDFRISITNGYVSS